jgi:hypothetical protein
MSSKFTWAACADIQLLLETGTPANLIANSYRISLWQVYKMRETLRIFGEIASDAA